MDYKESTKQLLELTAQATSPFHAVAYVKEQLLGAGFEQLYLKDEWCLEAGGSYFMVHHGTCLMAFKVGEKQGGRQCFRIGAAHTDYPGLRIKTNPEMVSEGYAQLNVEVYGGAILSTWMDRPLSAAGRVVLKSDDIFRPGIRLVDFKRPIMTIPNLAIHFNREVNKGVELNRQKDMLPVLGMMEGMLNKEQFFLKALAAELEVAVEDILDFELNIYNMDEGMVIGLNEDMISSPRLDDMTGVQSVVSGLLESRPTEGIHVAALFDHEEIGSKTKQGGGSTLMAILLEKISGSLGKTNLQYIASLPESMLISVDVAHAVHPNKADKYDPVNKARLNQGFVIKEACSQSYATDSEAIAITQQICHKEGIPYQKITNRSDAVGGGTLGSIASAMLPIKTVDIGVGLIAMHSSRELVGVADQAGIVNLMKAFYDLPIS